MTTALLVSIKGEQPPLQGDGVLARVAALLERARERGVPVLHIRHDGGAGDILERGTPGWEIHPDVAPRGAEPVVDKSHFSAFHDTDLDQRLRVLGVTRLVVAGMQTEFCVDSACRAAHGLGYAVTLVSEGHTTFDTPDLTAAQVIAHHNRILHRGGFVEPAEAAAVEF